MPAPDELPELLRERLKRQRRRSRAVLAGFAVTLCATLAVFFLLAQSLKLSPANRVLYAVNAPSGSVWILDQQLPLPGQGPAATGSFRTLELGADGPNAGPRYEGGVYSAARHEDALYITTISRLLRFERDGTGWRMASGESLGLNDPGATPVVASLRGTLWLFWAHGAELRARRALNVEDSAQTVFKAAAAIQRLHAVGSPAAIWLGMLSREGELHLLVVDPDLAAVEGDDKQPGLAVLRSVMAPGKVARSSFAVMGDDPATAVPVLAWLPGEESGRQWLLGAVSAGDGSDEGAWRDLPPLPQQATTFGQEGAGFVTLLAREGGLEAWFSDRGRVMHCKSPWTSPADVVWSEAVPASLDEGASEAAQLAWTALLFVLALALMSQGVYLVLNRERPQDRSLNELLQRASGEPRKDRPENKLVFAAGPARAFALFIDLAMTCPALILLQGVYDYRWEDAYGFIVFVNFGGTEGDILRTVTASVITLSVLVMYSLFCEMMWGRTLGKALLRLRVVDLKGDAPAPWRLVVRNLIKIVELIHWTVVMIPLGMMMFSGKQQRLGDLAAGTVVVIDVVPEESPDDIDV